jgi:hypothetical protein
MSSKWRNLKLVARHCDGIETPVVQPVFPMIFDLQSDPQERYNLSNYRFDGMWMAQPLFTPLAEYEKSIQAMPNIKPGTDDDFKGYGLIARGEHALQVKAEKKAGLQPE